MLKNLNRHILIKVSNMKFKLIEDINRGHENVSSNELLDEDIGTVNKLV